MDSYLSTQRSTIFSHVGVMIYVFDVESREMAKDLEYYRDCLDGLSQFSKEANVFLLVHKMDLIRDGERSVVLQRKLGELEKASGDVSVRVHGTSIYDETLYKVHLSFPINCSTTDSKPEAWSSIINTLIPNARNLSKHLGIFAEACNATEVILFERTTFLVIATSSSDVSESTTAASTHALEGKRFERTSELIKAFKQSCSRLREEFHSLEMELAEFTVVLEELTKNTYVLVVVHDPVIGKRASKHVVGIGQTFLQKQQQSR